jgi:hypothetical protein
VLTTIAPEKIVKPIGQKGVLMPVTQKRVFNGQTLEAETKKLTFRKGCEGDI